MKRESIQSHIGETAQHVEELAAQISAAEAQVATITSAAEERLTHFEKVQPVLKPRGCLAAGRHPQDIARLVPTRLAEESAGDSRDTRTGCGEGGGVLSSRDPRRGRARGQRSHRHQSQKPTSAATATSSVSTEQPDDFVFGKSTGEVRCRSPLRRASFNSERCKVFCQRFST